MEKQVCPLCKTRLYLPYAEKGTHSGTRPRLCRTVKALNEQGITEYPHPDEHIKSEYHVHGDVPCEACAPLKKRGRKRKDDGHEDEDPADRVRRLTVLRGKRNRDKQGQAGVDKHRETQQKWRQQRRQGQNQKQGGEIAALSNSREGIPGNRTALKLGLAAKTRGSRPSAASILAKKAAPLKPSALKSTSVKPSAQKPVTRLSLSDKLKDLSLGPGIEIRGRAPIRTTRAASGKSASAGRISSGGPSSRGASSTRTRFSGKLQSSGASKSPSPAAGTKIKVPSVGLNGPALPRSSRQKMNERRKESLVQ